MRNLALFILALVPYLILLRASPSPAPDPYPAVVSLPARARAPPSSNGHPAPPPPAPVVEHDLLDFVLISTVDGALHAVNRDDGNVKWTLRDGVDPLVGGDIRGGGSGEDFIVEPLTGGLYVFEEDMEGPSGQRRVRKLPLSVEQLIELSPFTFPQSPSQVFTGRKQTSLLTLDLRTGEQLDCYSSSWNDSLRNDPVRVCPNAQLLDELEGQGRSNRDVLFVGRTDFRLQIHNPSAAPFLFSSSAISPQVENRRPGSQEISYSTYTPNSFDKPLAEYWAKAGVVNTWGSESTSGGRTRIELGFDGMMVGVQEGGHVVWQEQLDSVGIAVYDILRPLSPSHANPILVPQPPPQLASVLPLPSDAKRSHIDLLSRPPTTYIGSVASSSQPDTRVETPDELPRTRLAGMTPAREPLLYALSSTSYPLINFAPPPRPGTSMNGTFLLSDDLPEDSQLYPYLIDPPKEDAVPAPTNQSSTDKADSVRPRDQKWIYTLICLLVSGFVAALAGIGYRGRTAVKGTPGSNSSWKALELDSHAQASISVEDVPSLPIESAVNGKDATVEKQVTFGMGHAGQAGSGEIAVGEPGGSTVKPAEVNGDGATATPKKKNGRRRVRGKKKRRNSGADLLDDENEQDDGDEEEKPDNTSTSSGPGSALGVAGTAGRKPLPDLPREMNSADLFDSNDKERLSISDCIVGYGSHGTVVLKGTWGGRPVAVKRLLSDFTRLASQEVKLLQASDDHPNVIRYYCQERRDNFLYIALDLCDASLADLIEAPDRHMALASALDHKKALQQVTAGLKHLHGMKIIHRDIKPQNVLVSRGKDGSLRMLVSDFGLARRLDQNQSSFAPTANNLAGSLGWRAPECIRGQVRLNEGFDNASVSSTSSTSSLNDLHGESEDKDPRNKSLARLTKAVDLFALGCLYFWILMGGEHPFGEVYDRESNIVKGDVVNIGQLDILGEEGCEAKHLIGRLLSVDPADRPDTAECLVHPFFWTAGRRLNFLCDASDRFEIMETDPPESTVVMLETGAQGVVGKDWHSKLDRTVLNNLGKYRKYKGHTVRDLLRVLRNKKHHYQDLEPIVKRHFGALPGGFLHYFTSRYPALFLHVHTVVKDSRLRHESMFEGYFSEAG